MAKRKDLDTELSKAEMRAKARDLAEVIGGDKETEKTLKKLISQVEKTGQPAQFTFTNDSGEKETLIIEPAGKDPKADAVKDGMPTVNVFREDSSGHREQLSREKTKKLFDYVKGTAKFVVNKIEQGRRALDNAIDHAVR